MPIAPPLNINIIRILILAHYKGAVRAADAGYRAEFVKHKILVVLHVFGENLEDEVVIA